MRRLLYAALALFFVLRYDLWLWDDARIVGGLPAGLLFHVAYCFAAAGLLGLLVRYAWPAGLEAGAERGEERP